MKRTLDRYMRLALSRLGHWRHNGGTVAIITALLIVPMTFALGLAYDYTMASNRKDQINGMADSATLGAVTPAMMMQSSATAQARSTALFLDQVQNVSGATVSAGDVAVTVTDTPFGATITRNVTLTYKAYSPNVFAGVLGLPAFQIGGNSSATSGGAPNIDFYLMLDTSPSMEIAATTAGLNTLSADTGYVDSSDRNCTFGCHQSNATPLTSCTNAPSHRDPATGLMTTACQFVTSSAQKIPCTSSGTYGDHTAFTSSSTFPLTGRDFYDLSRCTGVTLRIDLLNTAAQNLMDTATTTEASNHAAYRMAIYETDVNQANPANDLNLYTLEPLTSNLADAKSKAATIASLEMCINNDLVCGDSSNSDMDTYLDRDLSTLNTSTSLLPTPGNGTNNAGDTPQEVLFIVTDGLNDQGSPRSYPPMDWNGTTCAAIKARGIRIAVLYTQYIAGSGGSWYTGHVQPGLPTGLPPGLPTSTPNPGDPMSLAAQQCASTGLYYEITTDGDVSAALQTLFLKAVSTARLTG
jgi:Flp pilus assembly protein TadG